MVDGEREVFRMLLPLSLCVVERAVDLAVTFFVSIEENDAVL